MDRVAIASAYAEGWMAPAAAAPGPHWFAVYTRSNFEKKVASELAARRVDSYLPLVEQVHQWKDRRKVVETPVFPGYVFARFADEPSARLKVLRALGVVRILGQGESIEPVPDGEVESIRRLLQAHVPCFAHPFLREGAWVRVKRGPLKDVEGLLVRVKSKTRLVLSVALLSQSVATEIDILDVEVLRPAAGRPRRPER